MCRITRQRVPWDRMHRTCHVQALAAAHLRLGFILPACSMSMTSFSCSLSVSGSSLHRRQRLGGGGGGGGGGGMGDSQHTCMWGDGNCRPCAAQPLLTAASAPHAAAAAPSCCAQSPWRVRPSCRGPQPVGWQRATQEQRPLHYSAPVGIRRVDLPPCLLLHHGACCRCCPGRNDARRRGTPPALRAAAAAGSSCRAGLAGCAALSSAQGQRSSP